jgi:hypothetical protein
VPFRTPPTARTARLSRLPRLRNSARAQATASTLAAVLALLLALITLGGSAPSADGRGCPHGRAAVTDQVTASCPQVTVAAPTHGRHHPGHDPSSIKTHHMATATHRPLCHTLLPAVDSPAPSGVPADAASSSDLALATTADCHPQVAQRQILRC